MYSALRIPNIEWQPENGHLPNYRELIDHLISKLTKEDNLVHNDNNLAKIAQDIVVHKKMDDDFLAKELDRLYSLEYFSTPLHQFYTHLPNLLGRIDSTFKHPIILTTTYDDVLVETFKKANLAFDLLYFRFMEGNQGKFHHTYFDKCESEAFSKESSIIDKPIDKPNEYENLKPYERPIIINVHGMVNRLGEHEGKHKGVFVVTEDNHVDHLTYDSITEQLLPATILAELRRSHFLFMGVCFSDWCLRSIFRRIWRGSSNGDYKSWVVQVGVDAKEKNLWNGYNIDVIDLPLIRYIADLNSQVQERASRGDEV